MAKPELGLKRQCMSCGAKFYDLNKDPIVCPKCGTAFQATQVAQARSVAPARVVREVEEPEVETAGGPEIVSLDDVEASENEKDVALDDDMDIGESGGDDDTFLEEEEEGEDDVSSLIDGDIEDDEEA